MHAARSPRGGRLMATTTADSKPASPSGRPSKSYANLLRELAITDYKIKYQGSFLGGYIWTIAKPLLIFGVLYLVFTRFVRFGNGVPDYAVKLRLGSVPWPDFPDCTRPAERVLPGRSELDQRD